MGAMRKAGVWLGLVEDDDERGYGERGYDERGYRYGEEFAEEEEVDEQALASTRSRVSERLAAEREARTERSTVRSITRPAPSTVSYPTRDNLALAPRVSERPATQAEEEERRYQITTLHPTTYNEARTIGEHFRDGVPVIMNLTEMDEADAKRLVEACAVPSSASPTECSCSRRPTSRSRQKTRRRSPRVGSSIRVERGSSAPWCYRSLCRSSTCCCTGSS